MIPDGLREQLDDVPISKIGEYLAERLDIDEGEMMLQLEFRDGRYQKMRRYDRPNGSSLGSASPDSGGRAHSS